MIADLRKLWLEAFQETQFFTDLFFTKGYSPDRCHYIGENGVPVSALYWFDCHLQGHKFAYIYGVATLKSHQGKGFAGQLLRETHEILKNQGYEGVLLVPAGEKLFDFYGKFGYEPATTATNLHCEAGDTPVAMREISPEEYIRLYPDFLPENSLVQGKEALGFLQGYGHFYAGDDFLLVYETKEKEPFAHELLGNTQAAPGILKALGFPKGRFRCPGTERKFTMWLPLTADCPKPGWFGLALD